MSAGTRKAMMPMPGIRAGLSAVRLTAVDARESCVGDGRPQDCLPRLRAIPQRVRIGR